MFDPLFQENEHALPIDFSPEEERGEEDDGESPLPEAIRLYLQEIGQYPLLTEEQERQYGYTIQRGTGSSHPESRAQAEEAKRHLIEANLRLVVHIAKRHQSQEQTLDLLDLIQEGTFGLLEAANRYNPHLGYRFSTYAYFWVRQTIRRGIANRGRCIRFPVYLHEQVHRLRVARFELYRHLQRDPTLAELAHHVGMPAERVQEIVTCMQRPISLELPMGQDGDTPLGKLLEDPHAPLPVEVAERAQIAEFLQEALSRLPARDQTILRLRFGLNGKAHTLEEIGSVLSLTRERVRQLERKALKALRADPMVREKLSAFLHE